MKIECSFPVQSKYHQVNGVLVIANGGDPPALIEGIHVSYLRGEEIVSKSLFPHFVVEQRSLRCDD